MSVTINVVCYKSKVLKNNESPLMIRICKDRKMKYQSLGISILPKYWDFKANKPTAKCPNKEYLEKLIAEKNNQTREVIGARAALRHAEHAKTGEYLMQNGEWKKKQ